MACAAIHLVLSYAFNFDFVYGTPNRLDDWLGLAGKSAWDGGFFGPIGWAIPMLPGENSNADKLARAARSASRRGGRKRYWLFSFPVARLPAFTPAKEYP